MAERHSGARFARAAEPPMALRVGFAEMHKADVLLYLCVPSVTPFPQLRLRHDTE